MNIRFGAALIAIAFGSFIFQVLPVMIGSSPPVEVAPKISRPEVIEPKAVAQNVVFHQPPVKEPPALPRPMEQLIADHPEPVRTFTQEKLYDPNSSVMYALQDAVPFGDEASHIRYLSLYNLSSSERRAYGQTVSFVIHSLSVRKKEHIPVFVDGSDNTVIRIDLDHYGIPAEAWDELATKGSGPRPFPEPYFHTITTQLEAKLEQKKVFKKVPTGRKFQDGTLEMRDQEVTEKVKAAPVGKLIFAPGIWLDLKSWHNLCEITGSVSPVLRADWFIANATLPPAYYNFLQLGNKVEDFAKFVFGDNATAEKAHAQDKGIVVSSIVARNNRTLTRSPSLGAPYNYYWQSHDSLKSINERDYSKNPLDEKFDATEDIATLPNGLQVYFLTDAKGNRLDAANTDIAVDNTARDRVVRTGRSCMICHSDGIRAIDDNIRNITAVFTNKNETVKLIGDDPEKIERIEDLFGSDLALQIADDQQHYARAIGRITGLSPQKNAAQLARIYDNYAEDLLTKEVVAREIGCTVPELEHYIRGIDIAPGQRIGTNDNVILGLLKDRPLRRDQYEQAHSFFMNVVYEIRAREGKK